MPTQTTQIAYPPLDSQATYDFIDSQLTASQKTGQLADDFKLALATILSLDVHQYSIDDLWHRYVKAIVANDSNARAGNPAGRSPPGRGGQHPKHFYTKEFLSNPGNANKYPLGSSNPEDFDYTTEIWNAIPQGGSSRIRGIYTPDGLTYYAADQGVFDGALQSDTMSTAYTETPTTNNAWTQLTGNDTVVSGIFLSADGTQVYLGGTGGNAIDHATMSTPFDLSTAGAWTATTLPSGSGRTNSFNFNDDGTILTIFDLNTDNVVNYTVPTPWDVTSIVASGVSYDPDGDSGWTTALPADTSIVCGTWNEDGSYALIISLGDQAVTCAASTPYDVTTLSYVSHQAMPVVPGTAIEDAYIRGGYIMFATGTDDRVRTYTTA